jgi:hypothetical protein
LLLILSDLRRLEFLVANPGCEGVLLLFVVLPVDHEMIFEFFVGVLVGSWVFRLLVIIEVNDLLRCLSVLGVVAIAFIAIAKVSGQSEIECLVFLPKIGFGHGVLIGKL